MIPDVVPPGRPESERRVFALLRRLPDDCWVYYEPLVVNRYPDFVVLIPDRGLLVIEVKGWHPATVLGGDLTNVLLKTGRATNPIRQARDYMLTLMEKCRRHSLSHMLTHPDGPNQGRFLFPFGYVALLSQITEDQLRHHSSGDLRRILPSEHVLAADEFDLWQELSGTALKKRLASFFDPSWPIALDATQVHALRAVVHPEIILPPTPNELAVRAVQQLELSDQAEPSSSRVLKTLDARQERLARRIGTGHRLLFGVAGAGKTVVLIARAKFLSDALPNGRILVLCFNVAFNRYLAGTLERYPNVRVSTFHGWGAANGVRWNGESPEDYGRRLLEVLETGEVRDASQFDAVLIDEAQDFDPSWFRCVSRAMKEPRDGDLLIVGDGNQTTYKLGQVSWKSLGINAAGRSTILKQNYRNTRPIQTAAGYFSASHELTDGIAATACEPTSARRDSTIFPVLFGCSSRDEEIKTVHSTVQGLLAGDYLGSKVPALRPSEIGIFYRKNQRNGLIEKLRERLASLATVVWLNEANLPGNSDSRKRVLEPGIKLQTIHSAKGLQYRAVVVMFADQLGSGENDDLQEERRLLYVALTRPEDILVVTCTTLPGRPITPILGEILRSGALRQG